PPPQIAPNGCRSADRKKSRITGAQPHLVGGTRGRSFPRRSAFAVRRILYLAESDARFPAGISHATFRRAVRNHLWLGTRHTLRSVLRAGAKNGRGGYAPRVHGD